jgi:septal ring factor EnvC (AmiA/AmiB activator)
MDRIIQMVEAHLQNVSQAINDLINQKTSIEQEISKLQQYLDDGLKDLEKLKLEQQEK